MSSQSSEALDNISVQLLAKMCLQKKDISVDWLMKEQHIKDRKKAEKKHARYVKAGFLYLKDGLYRFRLVPKKEK